MSQEGIYKEIWVNTSLSRAIGEDITSLLRPDIIAETYSGTYVVVEMVSPSQTFTQLLNKVQSMKSLLGPLFGGWGVIQP